MKTIAIFATILALAWARSVDPVLPRPEAPIARPGVQSQVISFPNAANPIIRFHVNVKGDYDRRLPARVVRSILPEWLIGQRESRPMPRPGQSFPEIELPPRVRPRPEVPGGQLPEIRPELPIPQNPLPEIEIPKGNLPELPSPPKGNLPSLPELPERRPLPNPRPEVAPGNPLPEISAPGIVLPEVLPQPGNPLPEISAPGIVLPEVLPRPGLPLPPQKGPRPEVKPGNPLPEIELPGVVLPEIVAPEGGRRPMPQPELPMPELKLPEVLPRPGNPIPELKLPEVLPRPGNPMPELKLPEVLPRPGNPLPEIELPGVVLPEVVAPESGRRPNPLPEISVPENEQFVFFYPNREEAQVKLRIQVNDFEIFGRSDLRAQLPAALSLLDPNPIVPAPPQRIQPKIEFGQPAIEVFIDIGETETYY